MRTTDHFFALLLVSSLYLVTAGSAVRGAQQEKKQTVSDLDRLMEGIHSDLKELKKGHPWLSEYSDRCINTDKSDGHKFIFYAREPTPDLGDSMSAQPSFIWIECCPVDRDDRENVVKGVPACQFSSLKSKVWAKLLIRESAATADAIRTRIVKRCEALHEKIEKGGVPESQQGSSASRDDQTGGKKDE